MAIIESEYGLTHEIDFGAMAFFGTEALESDIRTEERGETPEIIHMDIGRRVVERTAGASDTNPDNYFFS